MLEQVSTSVKFLAFYTASKQGKTGLTVTVDIYNPSGSQIVTAGSATAIGGGLYAYTLSTNNSAEGEYAAIFKTNDATVDAQHIPSLWVLGRAGVENLDATVSSRSTLTAAQVNAEANTALSDVGLTNTVTGRIDQAISTRLAGSAYTAPTTAPTAAAVASAVRSELTEISNLDASVSSRLASSAYTAAPTTSQIATALEGSLLNEADGQAVLNAIVGAIGNTNVSEVALVAAIRTDIERAGGKLDSVPTAAANASAVWGTAAKTISGGTVDTLTNSPSVPSAAAIASATRSELAVELARVDASVSSRMAASEASKLDAVKAKTDALNTERLQNCATTSIVGNLIAQANS
jgi:hypothetical protein